MKAITVCFITLICLGLSIADPSIRGVDIPDSDDNVQVTVGPVGIDAVFNEGGQLDACLLRSSDSADSCNPGQLPASADGDDVISHQFERHGGKKRHLDVVDADAHNSDGQLDLFFHKIWIIDGLSFVDHGVKHPLPNILGMIKILSQSEEKIEAQFTLANEINFSLIRQPNDADGEDEEDHDTNATKEDSLAKISSHPFIPPHHSTTWTVEVANKTNLSGTPKDVLIEEKIQQSFLFDGATIQLDVVVSPRHFARLLISVEHDDGQLSSFQLLPLPHISALISSSRTIEGEWHTMIKSDQVDDDKALDVTLSITRLTGKLYLLIIEGINTHHTVMTVNRKGELSLDAISSTNLTPDDKELGDIENDFISRISMASRLSVENESNDDTTTTIPTLIFTNPNHPDFLTTTFTRPAHSDGERLFHQLPKSQWVWMPDSLVIQNTTDTSNPTIDFNPSAAKSSVAVRLDLRRYEHAVMIDVLVGKHSRLRAVQLPTMAKSREPIRSIVDIVSTSEATEKVDVNEIKVAEFMKKILDQFDVIDADASGAFITLIGPEASISFSAAPVPSPGLWVMENRVSQINGDTLDVAHNDRRVSLGVVKDGEKLRGTLHGDVVLMDFMIRDMNDKAGEFDWRVQQLAARRIPKHEDSNVQNESLDYLISQFFHDGVKVEVGRGLDVAGLIFSNNNGDSLVFLHPLDLTVALVGDWELLSASRNGQELSVERDSKHSREKNERISLKLLPGGVGELYGKLKSASATYGVHLKEILPQPARVEQSGKNLSEREVITPQLWSLDLIRLSRKWMKGEMGGASLEKDDSVAELLANCEGLSVEAGATSLKIKCADGEAEFVKVLETRLRYLIQGNWTVEFVTTESSVEDLREPEILGAVAVYHSDGTGLQIRLEKSNGAIGEGMQLAGEVDDPDYWRSDCIVGYKATVSRALNRRPVAEFQLIVNPFGATRIVDLKKISSEEQVGDGIPSKKIEKLESLLLDFLTTASSTPSSNDSDHNETLSTMMIEVTPSELLLTDGNSMLALSRAPTHSTIEVVVLSGIIEPAFSIGAPVPLNRSNNEETDESSTSHAIHMMKVMRRRLQAAEKLTEIIQSAYPEEQKPQPSSTVFE